jgi:hypothetical protein
MVVVGDATPTQQHRRRAPRRQAHEARGRKLSGEREETGGGGGGENDSWK